MKNLIGTICALAVVMASAPVSAQVVAPSPVALREQSSKTGNITTGGSDCSVATNCVSLSAPGANTFTVNIAGTFVGTGQFEGTIDNGTTFVAVKAVPLGGGVPVTSFTGTGQWQIAVAGVRQVRVRCSAYTSGTITAWINATSGVAGRPALQDGGGRAIAGNIDRLSYSAVTTEAVGTAAKALGAIEADGTNLLRLRYIKICLDPTALQTGAGERTLVLYPTTAASAAGSTQTAIPNASGDAAFAGVARTGALTTTPAIGSVTTATAIWSATIFLPAAATTAVPCVEKVWGTGEGIKPPTSGTATTSGLALGDLTGGAGGTGNYIITMQWAAEPN